MEEAGQGRAARHCSFSANQSGRARHRLHLKSQLAPGAGRNEALPAAPALPCSRSSRPWGFSFLPSPWPFSSSSCTAVRDGGRWLFGAEQKRPERAGRIPHSSSPRRAACLPSLHANSKQAVIIRDALNNCGYFFSSQYSKKAKNSLWFLSQLFFFFSPPSLSLLFPSHHLRDLDKPGRWASSVPGFVPTWGCCGESRGDQRDPGVPPTSATA